MTIFTIFGIIGAIVSLLFLIQVLYILYILIVICKAELTTLEKQLETLICINQDDSIPHEDEVKHQ